MFSSPSVQASLEQQKRPVTESFFGAKKKEGKTFFSVRAATGRSRTNRQTDRQTYTMGKIAAQICVSFVCRKKRFVSAIKSFVKVSHLNKRCFLPWVGLSDRTDGEELRLEVFVELKYLF